MKVLRLHGQGNFELCDEPEPIPLDDPLLTLDNCLIVPHIASSSVKTRNKMAMMAAENLLAGLAGKRLPYCANPAVYPAP